MGLLDILNAFKLVKDDITAGTYVKAARDIVPGWLALCDFAEGLGFKAGPDDDALKDEIADTIRECADLCKADKTKAAAGAVDWKSLLSTMLLALLQWWANKP